MRRTKEDAEQTREDIFRSGIKVFARKGYAAATMNDIAREAGVTRGAIYWHFKNKEDFYVEITSRLDNYYSEMMEEGLAWIEDGALQEYEGQVVDEMVQVCTDVLRRFLDDDDFRAMNEISLQVSIDGQTDTRGRTRMNDKSAAAVEFFSELIRRRAIYDKWTPESADMALAAFLNGLLVLVLHDKSLFTTERIEQVMDFFRRGFLPRPEQHVIARKGTETEGAKK